MCKRMHEVHTTLRQSKHTLVETHISSASVKIFSFNAPVLLEIEMCPRREGKTTCHHHRARRRGRGVVEKIHADILDLALLLFLLNYHTYNAFA